MNRPSAVDGIVSGIISKSFQEVYLCCFDVPFEFYDEMMFFRRLTCLEHFVWKLKLSTFAIISSSLQIILARTRCELVYSSYSWPPFKLSTRLHSAIFSLFHDYK